MPLVKKWIKLVLLICVVDAAMVFKSYNFLASALSGDLFLFQTEISKFKFIKYPTGDLLSFHPQPQHEDC